MRRLRTISLGAAISAVVVAAVVAAAFLFWRHAIQGGGPAVPAGASAPARVWTPITTQALSHGRFRKLTVYSPHSTPRGFVLLLSGAEGWTPMMAAVADRIAAQGAMVVGIDAGELDASLEEDGAGCVFPDGDLENLSHFVQAYFHLPTYLSPILAGYAGGATFAYAMLAQAPVNTFAGAVSLQFCPGYPLKKRLCKGSGVEFTARTGDGGVDFLPARQIRNPWTVVQGPDRGSRRPQACDAGAVRNFVAQVPGATLVTASAALAPPDAASPAAPPFDWPREYADAFETLLTRNAPAAEAGVPDALKDLPIVPVAAESGAAPQDTFAILLSGDGGWAGLDKEVAGALSAAGIPVVGLDSLRYFWSARTPAGLASDLDRMIDYYARQLGRQRALLIGYSQGADVLPFAVNRLTPAARSHVALTAVMGMSEHALFEFHMSSWVSDDDSGPPTRPEVESITGMPVLCIYGEEETDSLCPRLDSRRIMVVKLKGGHHFDGDYAALAQTIIKNVQPEVKTVQPQAPPAPRTSPSG